MLEPIPPQDIEAEQAVLGACILDGDAALVATQALRPTDFYRSAHSVVFGAIQTIIKDGRQCDVIVLRDQIKSEGALEQIGGTEYIHQLAVAVPSAAMIDRYIGIVQKESARRQLISSATALLQDAESPTCDPAEARAKHEERLRAVDVVKSVSLTTEEVLAQAANEVSLPTQLEDVDLNTGGLMCGVNILAGNAGAGKSTFGLQVMMNEAKAGRRTYMIAADQKLSGQAQFMWSNYAGVEIPNLNEFSDEYFDVIGWPLQWYDGRFELPAILAIMRFQAARGTRIFMVDYLGLIQYPVMHKQHERKEHITENIKLLAQELKLYVILISRGNKVPPGARPAMRDVEGGAGVANAADQIWWFQPDDKNPQKVEILAFKSRQNYTREGIFLHLDGPKHRFEDWDSRYELADQSMGGQFGK